MTVRNLTGCLLFLFAGPLLFPQDRVIYDDNKEEIGKILTQSSNEILFRFQSIEKKIPKNEIKMLQPDFLQDKHFQAARELLETSVKKFPDTDANKILLVKTFFKSDFLTNAETILAAGRGEGYLLMAAYLALKKLGGVKALPLLRAISESQLSTPEKIDRAILLSFTYADLGKPEEAMRVLKTFETSQPSLLRAQFTLLARVLDLDTWLKECRLVALDLRQKKHGDPVPPNLMQFYRAVDERRVNSLELAYPPSLAQFGRNSRKTVLGILSLSSFGATALSGTLFGVMTYQTYLAAEKYKYATADFDKRFSEWQTTQTLSVGALILTGVFAIAGVVTGIFHVILPEKEYFHFSLTPAKDLKGVGVQVTSLF